MGPLKLSSFTTNVRNATQRQNVELEVNYWIAYISWSKLSGYYESNEQILCGKVKLVQTKKKVRN